MRIKFKVFIIMSVPVFLITVIPFSALCITYQVSLSLISKFSEDLYLDQQSQMKSLLGAYGFEFSKVFQSFSENLQAINNFEKQIIRGEVKIHSGFIKPIGNSAKMAKNFENPQLLASSFKNPFFITTWYTSATLEEGELTEDQINQIKVVSVSDALSRAVRYENKVTTHLRKILIKDFYQGFSKDGLFTINYSINILMNKYIPPVGCPYTVKYPFETRCLLWFLEPIRRARITPIEPLLIYSQSQIPFLTSNICRRVPKYEIDSNGKLHQTKCGYSVECMTFRLSTIQAFFEQVNFQSSKTIMIEPRSEKVIYNSVSGLPKFNTYLSDAAKDLFPLNKETQNEFVKAIQVRMARNPSEMDPLEKLITEEESKCSLNFKKVAQSLGFQQINYQKNSQIFQSINKKDPAFYQAYYNPKSFTFISQEGEEYFIAINSIISIEKIKDDSLLESLGQKQLFDLQDLFVVIDVLPKNKLTSWTDKLKIQIKSILLYFGIASIIICSSFLLLTGLISYQIGVMIEKPLIHMIDVLQRLEKEGGVAALALIEEFENYQDDTVFLSLDYKILFDSFIDIFKMVHKATQSIFTVEESCSLLQLNYQINFFRNFRNNRVLGVCYNNIGNIHFQNQRYLEAMESYSQSILFAYYEAGIYSDKEWNNESSIKFQMNEQVEQEDQNTSSQTQTLGDAINNKKVHEQKTSIFPKSVSSTNTSQLNGLLQRIRKSTSKTTYLGDEVPIKSVRRNRNQVSRIILEVIFERKLNFSQAVFMHNISQEDNPSNFGLLNAKRSKVQTLIDWEIYQQLLRELIEISNQFTDPSYGKNAILCSQMSLCFLKMGKLEEAAYFQNEAIKNYQSAILLEDFVKKSSKCKNGEEFIFSLCSKTMNKNNLSVHYQDAKQGAEVTEYGDYTFLFDNVEKKEIQGKDKHFLQRGGQITNVQDEGFTNSILEIFHLRQTTFKNKNIVKQNQIATQSIAELTSRKTFQHTLLANISETDSIQMFPNLKVSKVLSPDCFLIQKQQDEASSKLCLKRKSNSNIQMPQEQIIEQCLSPKKSSKVLKSKQESEEENNQEQFRGQIKNKQTKDLIIKEKKGDHQIRSKSSQESNRNIEDTSIACDQLTLQETIVHNNKKRGTSPFRKYQTYDKNQAPIEYLSPFIYPRCKKISCLNSKASSEIPEEAQDNTLNLRQKQSDSLEHSVNISQSSEFNNSRKIRKVEKSKVNKILEKEDLEKIQKYELPGDVLLFYVGLQESRILLAEGSNRSAAFVLTELLENTQFYLPFQRATCLSMLTDILKENQLQADSLTKMKSRFNENITFSVSAVLAVNSKYSKAAKTCLSLVDDVLTNQQDCFSLLIYSQNSFQQVMSSLCIKQLRATGTLFNSIIEQLSNKNNISKLSDRSNYHSQTKQNLLNIQIPRDSSLSYSSPSRLPSNSPPYRSTFLLSNQPSSEQLHSFNNPIKQDNHSDKFVSQKSWTKELLDQLTDLDYVNEKSIKDTQIFNNNEDNQRLGDLFSQNSLQTSLLRNNTDNKYFFHSNDDGPCFSQVQLPQNSLNIQNFNNFESSLQEGELISPNSSTNKLNNQKEIISVLKQRHHSLNSPLVKIDDSKSDQSRFIGSYPINQLGVKQKCGFFCQKMPFSTPVQSESIQNINLEQNKRTSQKLNKNPFGLLIKENKEQQNRNEHFPDYLKQPDFKQQQIQSDTKDQFLNKTVDNNSQSQLTINQIPKTLFLQQEDNNQQQQQDKHESAKNINLVLHFAVRKAILSYFNNNSLLLDRQKRLTELNLLSNSTKFILFITDNAGITQNKAYFMMSHLLYETQIQLLVLQLDFEESVSEHNQITNHYVNNKPVIKYFYTQEKLLQYIRNQREPMNNFGIPLLVEHFSI